MKKLVLGIDLDGVLCDFNYGFKNKLFEVSGKRLIKLDEEPKCWNYPKEYGYTSKEADAAWDSVKADKLFWATLRREDGALNALAILHAMRLSGHEVYFITVRMGIDPHLQSTYWLLNNGFNHPCVLITRGDKGQLAKGLGLTHLIDDKPENCLTVREGSPETKVWLLARRWNETSRANLLAHFTDNPIRLAWSVQEFLREASDDAESGTSPTVS